MIEEQNKKKKRTPEEEADRDRELDFESYSTKREREEILEQTARENKRLKADTKRFMAALDEQKAALEDQKILLESFKQQLDAAQQLKTNSAPTATNLVTTTSSEISNLEETNNNSNVSSAVPATTQMAVYHPMTPVTLGDPVTEVLLSKWTQYHNTLKSAGNTVTITSTMTPNMALDVLDYLTGTKVLATDSTTDALNDMDFEKLRESLEIFFVKGRHNDIKAGGKGSLATAQAMRFILTVSKETGLMDHSTVSLEHRTRIQALRELESKFKDEQKTVLWLRSMLSRLCMKL